MNQYDGMTDDELVNRADAGLHGQGAVVEEMWRLKAAITRLDESSTKLGTRMYWLTWAIAILTGIMVIPILLGLLRWLER